MKPSCIPQVSSNISLNRPRCNTSYAACRARFTFAAWQPGRAADGLALSSRNQYLSQAERAEAPRLYRTLQTIAQSAQAGNHNFAALAQVARNELHAHGWAVDYVEIRQAVSLKPAQVSDTQLVALAAAKLGNTRLIDNLEFAL